MVVDFSQHRTTTALIVAVIVLTMGFYYYQQREIVNLKRTIMDLQREFYLRLRSLADCAGEEEETTSRDEDPPALLESPESPDISSEVVPIINKEP